jgi:hypothetical protein
LGRPNSSLLRAHQRTLFYLPDFQRRVISFSKAPPITDLESFFLLKELDMAVSSGDDDAAYV